MSRYVVASIGTTHPWNIAGIGLDLQIANEFGVNDLSVVAAVSAQDAEGLHAVAPIPLEVLTAQIASLPFAELGAFRVGALVGAEQVHAIAQTLRAHPEISAVVDPVFGATLGGVFANDATVAAIRDELAALPSVILTPNVSEAARLLGRTIARAEMPDAARALQARGPAAVLLTGGDQPGDPVDVLATGNRIETFESERIAGAMRGAGCTLAMALACELARGLPLREAVLSARRYVRARMEAGAAFGGLQVAF